MATESKGVPLSTDASQAPMPAGAVFLSYASEDVAAAERIATALRSAGIEVWFDRNELRGGDVWDQKIRSEIRDCALFIPIISHHTQVRLEGYFRREWRLAIERMHDMAEQKPFLLPVVIDGTRDQEAVVPDAFRAVQWTRLPAGETPTVFVDRVQRLLSGEASTVKRADGGAREHAPAGSRRLLPAAIAVVILGAAAYFTVNKLWIAKTPASSPKLAPVAATPAGFSPPPHSIAVLPFVNMSGDKEQEYFSEGLSEELLNDLSRIKELQVAARTSAFLFKGKDADIGTIARKLNVGAVLEGSVRRSARKVRITTQLINAVSGFHIWSQTYDRDLGDVLKLQSEIAEAVASALKVTLLGEVVTRMEVGGTHNLAAYDAYLRALNVYWQAHNASDLERAIAGYTEATRLDPDFALAFAGWSIALVANADNDPARLSLAQAPALKAVALAPDLAEGHLALALLSDQSFDFRRASAEFERALALAPGNARILKDYGEFSVRMGHAEAGLAAARRSAVLDPSNVGWLGNALKWARHYDESAQAYQNVLSSAPDDFGAQWGLMTLNYYLGEFQKVRSLCEGKLKAIDEAACQWYLTMTYRKLGRDADAETSLRRFIVLRGESVGQYELATIYAQWGDIAQALGRLESALRDREGDLEFLRVDPLIDPLRNEPRFHAIERALKFPD